MDAAKRWEIQRRPIRLADPETVMFRLWELGHEHNPDHPTGVDPDEPDEAVSIRDLLDHRAQTGVYSYMEFFAGEMDELCLKHHKRRARLDGVVGPAFEELLNRPRCDFPDYLTAGREQANWPDSCRRELKVARDFEKLPGLTKEETDQAWWAACNVLTASIKDVEITPLPYGQTEGAHIVATSGNLRGSTLAWSELARNSCRDRLQQKYNLIKWAIQYLATVITHEVIHALGGPHVRDSRATEYPSIHEHSIARWGWPNDTDSQMLESLGYTMSGVEPLPGDVLVRPRDEQPDDPDPPDEPDDPPTDPEQLWFRGSLQAMRGDEPTGHEFILKPKARI